MNTQIKILLYLFLVGGMLYYVQYKYKIFEVSLTNPLVKNEIESNREENESKGLEILNSEGKNIYVEVDIADSVESRKQGLSGRTELGDYQGMLFVFEEKGSYSFWMKDMYIPLDLIYIDENSYIVDILENIQPCDELECFSFLPAKPFKYVLEVNSGFAELNKINIGNAVIFDISSQE